jgi:hypothetical protein
MSGDISSYLALVANEHVYQPNFMASLAALLQPVADDIDVLNSMPGLYDLDVAVGVQLDAVGLWIGPSRYVTIPLTGIYFSFDIAHVGFDQGVWYRPGIDPDSGVVTLNDDIYRLYLRAAVGRNYWDGSVQGAYDIFLPLLAPFGTGITITDNSNMTITVAFTGSPPPAYVAAMFESGYIQLKPPGVAQTGP